MRSGSLDVRELPFHVQTALDSPEIGASCLCLLTMTGLMTELSEPNNRPRVRDMSDGEWLTYTEAAKRLGTTPDAIRQRVKRGHMQGSRGNDGRPKVWTDVRLTEHATERSPDSPKWTEFEQTERSGQVKALEDHIETLKADLAEARQHRDRDRADHATELERVQIRLIEERDAARVEAREARSEADQAKADQIGMARDVAAMFDKLKALTDKHAALHADQARLQAELEQARAELARARRPWWRRLVKL